MPISNTRPRPRLRLMLLAALAATGVAATTFGAAEAQAHGTCQATPSIGKNSSTGNIVGRATFSCTSFHNLLSVSVYIERRNEAGTWTAVSETGEGAGSGTSQSARIAIPCGVSGDYRAVALGRTGNADTATPHISQNPGTRSNIDCFSSDLLNPAGPVELALFRVPSVGAING